MRCMYSCIYIDIDMYVHLIDVAINDQVLLDIFGRQKKGNRFVDNTGGLAMMAICEARPRRHYVLYTYR